MLAIITQESQRVPHDKLRYDDVKLGQNEKSFIGSNISLANS